MIRATEERAAHQGDIRAGRRIQRPLPTEAIRIGLDSRCGGGVPDAAPRPVAAPIPVRPLGAPELNPAVIEKV